MMLMHVVFTHLLISYYKPYLIISDDTYDTVFQTVSGHALILRVHLPQGTTKPPGMTLVGVIAQHSWLDTRMRITGYQPISSESSWTSSGLKLGTAVNAVVQHMQLNPPEVIQITDDSLQRIQASIAPQEQQKQQQSSPLPNPVASGASEPPPDYNTILHADEESVEMSHMVSFDITRLLELTCP